jgi:hypothetical protein
LLDWWKMGDYGPDYPGTMTNMESTDLVGDSPKYWGFDMKSLQFDGVDEYVTMGNVLTIERNVAFSFSFWFRTRVSAAQWFASKMEGSPNYKGLGLTYDLGKVGLILRADYTGTNQISLACTRADLGDGRWHHVAWTFAGTSLASGVHCYIDGLEDTLVVGSDSLTANVATTTAFVLGAPYSALESGYAFFAGGLDEMSVYNRALSSSEVQWIYNSSAPRSLKDPAAPANLVAYWRMGANAYPGTMVNMESGDIVSEQLSGGSGMFIPLRFNSGGIGGLLGYASNLGEGGGGATIRYLKRARDLGSGPPAVYTEWVTEDIDSSPPTSPPVGPWGDIKVVGSWYSPV